MERARLLPIRYGLRTLLLCVTAFAVAFGYYADRVFRQKQAVAELRAAGCHIRFDHEISESAHRVQPFAPRWIRKSVGDDWASRVADVEFWNSESGPRFTDEDAQHLRSVPYLTLLKLEWSAISDEGAAAIAEMKDLKILSLRQTRITDAALPHIAQAKGLESLDLAETEVTDVGIAYLTQLKSLRWLDLENTRISDDAIDRISDLKQLEWLLLGNTGITDRGLKQLSKMHSLTNLSLIPKCRVSDDAVRKLAVELPNCHIYHGAVPDRPE